MRMSDEEFEVLDELYFVTSFDALIEEVELEKEILKTTLFRLIEKKWVKCLDETKDNPVEVIEIKELDSPKIFFLATKEGLLAHNVTG